MKRIRIVLADDHVIVLDGLEQLFRLEPEFEVVARSTTAEARRESGAGTSAGRRWCSTW